MKDTKKYLEIFQKRRKIKIKKTSTFLSENIDEKENEK